MQKGIRPPPSELHVAVLDGFAIIGLRSRESKWTYLELRLLKHVDVSLLQRIVTFTEAELSEPYSIHTYRALVSSEPHLSFIVFDVTDRYDSPPEVAEEGSLVLEIVNQKKPNLSSLSNARKAHFDTPWIAVSVNRLETGPEETINHVHPEHLKFISKDEQVNRSTVKLLTGYLAMLVVSPNYRRQRIGWIIGNLCLHMMRNNGACTAAIETECVNKAALNLYSQLGFLNVKKMPRFYSSGHDALRLESFFGMDSPLAIRRTEKVEDHRAAYKKRFGSDPDYVCLAPGRVNLIGEHVDHQGFSVLPAALNHSIIAAVTAHPTKKVTKDASPVLVLEHENHALFPRVTFRSWKELCVASTPIWTNYIVAALMGLIEYISTKDFKKVGTLVPSHKPLPSNLVEVIEKQLGQANSTCLHLYLNGDVPIASGVSSSSALVVVSSVALGAILIGPPTPKAQKDGALPSRILLAEICANAERHTGVTGGGMDQAAISLSSRGQAQLIHFEPLRTELIPIPKGGAIVVCDSCRSVPKAVSAATCYNKRVFELKLASFMLLKALKPDDPTLAPEKLPILTLRQVLEKANLPREAAVEAVKKHIPNKPMSRADVVQVLGYDRIEALINARSATAVWERNVIFEPFRRALHVYEEAHRVFEFARICRSTSEDSVSQLKQLGRILKASHESLTLYFDCGCPELSELTEMAQEAGAYGSRVTGAGWGGCMMALIREDEIESFIGKMKKFYSKQNRIVPLEPREDYDKCVFAVLPDDGAMCFAITAPDAAVKELEWARD